MTQRRWVPYALVAPATLFLGVLFLLPLVQTLAMSVQGSDGFSLANYARMLGDLNFADALRNTFVLTLIAVPAQLALALLMAVMIAKIGAGRDLVLWVWVIPLAISDLAAGLAWLAILQSTGYFNSALYGLGLLDGPTPWLTQETPLALLIGIALAEIWRATAIVLVILVAGMQLIPKEYAEAAEVFGATPWQRFRRVTLPLLKPSIQSALILRTVLAFEVFAVAYALGGRNFPVLVGEAYVWQGENQNTGVAAAYAALIMLISMLATFVYLRLLRTPREQMA
jgi:multiple sugar transport system permease protein